MKQTVNIARQIFSAILMITLLYTTLAMGALTGPVGTQTTVLYHSATGTLSGLCVAGNMAYFGRATTIRSYDLETDTDTISGYLPYNVGISMVNVLDDMLYTAIAQSWALPYPYQLGTIDPSLQFNGLLVLNGIFDSAIHTNGTMYLVANPDPNNYGTGHIGTGSCIFAYSSTGTLTCVATIGGDSGGIACDSKGNLYYAYQAAYPDPSQIIRFTAQQLQTGNLSISNAEVVADVAAGYLSFDQHDFLYATVGWGNGVNQYDPDTGRLIASIASDDTSGYGIGKFIWAESTKSFINLFTDWIGNQGFVYELIRPYHAGDYDRDGLTDNTVFDTAQGNWTTLLSASGQRTTRHWNGDAILPVSGDFDGDAFADLAVYWPQGGMWYIECSADGTVKSLNWGSENSIPVAGDYDGDGITDIAVYGRDGIWSIQYSSDTSLHSVAWGWDTAQAVPADYDGDHITDIAVFDAGTWSIQYSSDTSSNSVLWGSDNSIPVPADYDGDHITDIAVFDAGTWSIQYSSDTSSNSVLWNCDGAVPVPGDYDGDNRCDIAVQDAQRKQYILQSRTQSGRIVDMGYAGPYSIATNDAINVFDAPIPGYVGPDGDGLAYSNNYINPLFAAWATYVVSYSPADGVCTTYTNTQNALGPATGERYDVTALGDLSATQIDQGLPPGQITLGFDVTIANLNGPDFAVFENALLSKSDPPGYIFGELAFVEVATTTNFFARFPAHTLIAETDLSTNAGRGFAAFDPTGIYNLAGKHINGEFNCWGTPFNLDDLTNHPHVLAGHVDLMNIHYVRIVDIPGNGTFYDNATNGIYDAWQTSSSGGFDLEAVGVINFATECSIQSTGDALQLQWMAFTNRQYQVQWTDTLPAVLWHNAGPVIEGNNAMHTFSEPDRAESSMKIYRILRTYENN